MNEDVPHQSREPDKEGEHPGKVFRLGIIIPPARGVQSVLGGRISNGREDLSFNDSVDLFTVKVLLRYTSLFVVLGKLLHLSVLFSSHELLPQLGDSAQQDNPAATIETGQRTRAYQQGYQILAWGTDEPHSDWVKARSCYRPELPLQPKQSLNNSKLFDSAHVLDDKMKCGHRQNAQSGQVGKLQGVVAKIDFKNVYSK